MISSRSSDRHYHIITQDRFALQRHDYQFITSCQKHMICRFETLSRYGTGGFQKIFNRRKGCSIESVRFQYMIQQILPMLIVQQGLRIDMIPFDDRTGCRSAPVFHYFSGFFEISHLTVDSPDERRIQFFEYREYFVAYPVALIV